MRKLVSIPSLAASILWMSMYLPANAEDLSQYTPIPNVLPGESYIRLFNTLGSETNFEIRAFDRATGIEDVSRSQAVNLLPGTSKQMLIAKSPSDEEGASVTLYMRSDKANNQVVYQHVHYSPITGNFENMTVCSFDNTFNEMQAFSLLNRYLVNVHTSQIVGYTSYVGLTNPDDQERVVRMIITEANGGEWIGDLNVTIPANGSVTMSFPEIEQAIDWQPTPGLGQYHANIELRSGDMDALGVSLPYTAIPSHIVVNEATGYQSNTTQVCRVATSQEPVDVTGGTCHPNLGDNDSGAVGEVFSPSCPIVDFPAATNTKGRFNFGISPEVPLTAVDGTLEGDGDVDWYRVPLGKGNTYLFKLEGSLIKGELNSDIAESLSLRLRDPSGVLIPGAAVSGTSLFPTLGPTMLFTYTATQSGTHYVEVSAADGVATGGYQASITLTGVSDDVPPAKCLLGEYKSVPADEVTPLPYCADVDFPADTTTQGEIPFGPSFVTDNFVSGKINPSGDMDWYRASLTSGTAYEFVFSGQNQSESPSGSLNLRLRDPSGNLIPGAAFIATSPNPEGSLLVQFTYTATQSGTHYVEISATSETFIGWYEMRTRFVQ